MISLSKIEFFSFTASPEMSVYLVVVLLHSNEKYATGIPYISMFLILLKFYLNSSLKFL